MSYQPRYRVKCTRKGRKARSYIYSTAADAMACWLELPRRGYHRELWQVGGTLGRLL